MATFDGKALQLGIEHNVDLSILPSLAKVSISIKHYPNARKQ